MEWKKIVFAIAISLLYIPIVFMAVNTFFPETPRNTCYSIKPFPVGESENIIDAEREQYNQEMQECQEKYDEQRTKYDGWKFIAIMVINIIAALFMLMKVDKSIIFGLFFGVVITAFTAAINYMQSRSVVGFILLVFLFGLIVYFVNILSKEKN
jgi:uncharacterized protein (DUF983 family)